MIVTTRKSDDKIKEMLRDRGRVFLIGCGECATTCKTGGEKELLELKQKLESFGKQVTGMAIPDAPCIASQIKTVFAKNRKEISGSDAVLVAACGLGVQSAKENDRLGKDYLPGCDTKFIAAVDAKNDFQEYCSACSECVLDITGGICPVTRCSKGLLNGPCGGVDEGKCELDRERDCAWVLIYKELDKKKKLDLMKARQPARDYSLSNRPRALTLMKG
ncbi:MAG: methylenetetrahydrofolate reductase C-terminal domain-containing protein [Candidatus Omnitrophica bacterium]|nr:methylenetetrahydrofolate reductase C-terminal domain-containing protein [Candidatus Omnitrophota bacterium]